MLENNNSFPTHPETNYGLDCDMNLWAEFNKEVLIRNWIKSSRDCIVMKIYKPSGYEIDYGTSTERQLAELALQELVNNGYLNEHTYLKTEKSLGV